MVDEFENCDGVFLRARGSVQKRESVYCKRPEGKGLREVVSADVGSENGLGGGIIGSDERELRGNWIFAED